MLLFPSLETLQVALATAAFPPGVADTPAEAFFAADGAVGVRPSKAPSRAVRAALKRIGVEEVAPARFRNVPGEPVACWAQILPLRREPSVAPPGPTTPVVFELPGDQVPAFVAEVLRLGNDRQGLRWLDVGPDDRPRALLRVVGPPYYTLLRALDGDGGPDAPRAFVERAPRVLAELGYTHPLADRLRPPPGRLLLMGPPRRWSFVEDAPFRDIYEATDFALPSSATPWRAIDLPTRLTVPLRLARGDATEAATLWVLRDRAVPQIDELAKNADDRLLARLAFAATGDSGREAIVVRVRPSKQAPPVLVLDGLACRPYLRLPHLFLPVGTRLHPPLRRDAVVRLLAPDPARITWLSPSPDGGFVPESLPDEAFRPLDQWVDYVLDREPEPLAAWVQSARFDFEPFVCRDDIEPAPGPDRPRKRKRGQADSEHAEKDDDPVATGAGPRASRRSAHELDDLLPTPAAVEPDQAARRLRELEAEFVASEAPLDDPLRRSLWAEMATLNAALARTTDAAICWANADWEADAPSPAALESWARAEAKGSGRSIEDAAALDHLLAAAKPSAAEVRTLATALLRAAHAGRAFPGLAERLPQVGPFLERHETMVPVRVAWLAWCALARLARGDVLALARARDRVLERLHQHGLGRDLDLPSFLRFSGGGPAERARLARDHLLRLRDPAHDWLASGNWVGPFTASLADLMFAYGLARMGEAGASESLLDSGLSGLRKSDPVASWLGRAFAHRIRRALDGQPAAGPLPADLMGPLDAMGQQGSDEQRKQAKTLRYKIDRLREHSRILEPHEKIDPYRHWHGNLADPIVRELAAVVDLTDRAELDRRMARLLAPKPPGPRPEAQAAEILRTALQVAFRLGDAFARGLFDRVLPTVAGLDHLPRQAGLLERAIHLAAHFDQAGHVRAFVARFEALLDDADDRSAPALEPLLGQCFRGLRKLGLRDEIARLLDRMADLILRGRGVGATGSLSSVAERTGPGAVAWSRSLRLLLHVAAGWSYFGQADRALPVFDEARALLLTGDLPPIDQTALACGYVRALGQTPAAFALPRLDELFARLERVYDTFTVGSHYSLSRLDFIESVVLTLASDDFTLGDSGRRWLEDHEYLVRRRIHRDVRAAVASAEADPP